ncbi:MAG: tRNA (adenosine(37)-N6)-dimethylallyltransferase MiaA [SAR86 cluster bacterium]|uniref:tRNA dimethylallyltransferase n=1 Tax=SAR86 cluster bacterium TaxID=2030880 RepID=A0A520MRA1_9GAMM|nr:MAG: tRNA (adenosine(37)-N6)-dimethylallyltransferase MiaA [SAR86 cluster bacterium]
MKLSKKPIIFLLGPTASGKTDWAIDWHNQFEAIEIISVDSVMVYKECNVGSAKPSDATLEKYPHHLVNHVSLDSIFSVADFYAAAMELINNIHSREKIPLMVGGSMMYFNLLKTGISKLPPADRQLREKLEEKILTNGVEALHADLKKLDADAADNIKPQDSQRIIRAIEIITSTGISLDGNLASLPTSQLKDKYNLIEFGIFPLDRSKLHERIESRQGALVGDRLLEEITQIQNAFKISAEHPAMKAINYRQGLQVLEGKLEKSELFEKSLYATRQFAKRQCTWMRGWENLTYFDLHQGEEATEQLKKQLNLLQTV